MVRTQRLPQIPHSPTRIEAQEAEGVGDGDGTEFDLMEREIAMWALLVIANGYIAATLPRGPALIFGMVFIALAGVRYFA